MLVHSIYISNTTIVSIGSRAPSGMMSTRPYPVSMRSALRPDFMNLALRMMPRILIVEDELPMRTALKDCLEAEGYRRYLPLFQATATKHPTP